MALSKTFTTASNREDLTDILSILAPEETPIVSLAPKSRATNVLHEWTVDSLAAPSASGVLEGADVTSFTDKFAARARIGNYVQKFRRDYQVSDLQQAVESVGPARIAEAEVKAQRELTVSRAGYYSHYHLKGNNVTLVTQVVSY